MTNHPDYHGVIGHSRVISLLRREATNPSQTYLFTGPTGIGKATVAQRFAAALLCADEGQHTEACGSCHRVLASSHPDQILIEPAGTTMLTVDQARVTVSQAMMAPIQSHRKVFIFDEAGSMSDGAANALLKTLEEPSPTTIFILIAESEDALPPTVNSRCRTIHFGRIPEAELIAGLIDEGIDPRRAEEVSRIAGGRPGMALSLATEPLVAEYREAWLAIPTRLSSSTGGAFLLADELLGSVAPLLESLDQRHTDEVAEASEYDLPTKILKERHQREVRRAELNLLVAGLEVLASWYTDAAIAQHGGQVRNRDVPVHDLAMVPASVAVAGAERVLGAITAMRSNQRRRLVLTELLVELGAES